MKKKIFALLYMIVILLCARQCLNYFYNKYVLSFYNSKDYTINEDLLLTANFFEPYIVHYNNGNILYNNCLYQDAIEEYETALSYSDVPEDRDCLIRINIALSYCAQLDDDYANPKNIENSIELLNEARDVLLENGCATDDDDGHNDDAQELKNDIDRLLSELQAESSESEQEQEPSQSASASQNASTSDPQNPINSSQQETSDESEPSASNSETSEDPSNHSSTETSGETSAGETTGTPTQSAETNSPTTNFSEFESQAEENIRDESQAASSQRVQDLRDYEASQNSGYHNYNGIW